MDVKYNKMKKISSLSVMLILSAMLTGCRNSEYVEYPYPEINVPEVKLETNLETSSETNNININFYYDNTRSGTYYVANRNIELIENEEERKIAEDRVNDPAYVKFNNFFQSLLVNTNQSYNNKSYILQEKDGVYRWGEYLGGIFEKLGNKELYTFDDVPLPTNENGIKEGPLYMLVYDDEIKWNDGINVIFTDLAEQYCRNIDLAQTIRSKLSNGFSACVISTDFRYTGELSVPTIDSADALSQPKSIDTERAYHLIITGETNQLKEYIEKLKGNLDSFKVDYDITDITDYDEYNIFNKFELDETKVKPAQNLDELLEDETCEIDEDNIGDVYSDYIYNFELKDEFNVKRDIFETENIAENLITYSYIGGTKLDYASVNLEFALENEKPCDGGNISYHLGNKDEIECFYVMKSEDKENDEVTVEWKQMGSDEKFKAFEHLEINENQLIVSTDFENTPPISNTYYIKIPVYQQNNFESTKMPQWCSKYNADTADKIYTLTFQYNEFIENLTLINQINEEKCTGYIMVLFDELPF